MSTVPDTLANGKPMHIDWMTGDAIYDDEPDFDGPTPEEALEGAEMFACMNLDNFAPPTMTFAEFLANQARLCNIRDENPWFVWLGAQIAELAQRADFVRAQNPDQYEARAEVMRAPCHARTGIAQLRGIASGMAAYSNLPSVAGMIETAIELIEAHIGR